MSPSSTIFGWAILVATFLAPIFAVLTTRFIDGQREIRGRRLYIFRTLMATRRAQLTTDHVTALNLIEIDFWGKREVLEAWKAYFANLATNPHNNAEFEKACADRPAAHTKLLHAIAKVVHYDIEQLDIMAGGYAPQAVADTFQRQREIQTAILKVLSGEIPVHIKVDQ